MSLLTSSTNQDEGNRDPHCWKQKLKICNDIKTLEVGVRCVTPADGLNYFFDVETRRCSWCCQRIKPKMPKRFSRSDNLKVASITSINLGDILTCYLNCDTKKLIIYNQRSKQSEIFSDVEGQRILPIVRPVQHCQRGEPSNVYPLNTFFTLDI